jgi:hypothetical protein
MGDITSANAIFTITIPGVFSSPQQLQGFDVDAAISNDAVDVAEDKIGVDGILSAGFIFALVPMGIHLQADSASNNIFETWLAAQKTNLTTYLASAQIVLPAIGKKYALVNGVLKRPKQISDVNRVLQARTHSLDWQSINPANA